MLFTIFLLRTHYVSSDFYVKIVGHNLKYSHPRHCCYLYFKTMFHTQNLGIFIVNIRTKFHTHVSDTLLVSVIKPNGMSSFYITRKYCPKNL
jgi:hypothetical protein